LKLPDFARHWALELGVDEDSLEQLSGGINNRVFLCRSHQQNWVIKGYPYSNPDEFDRMRAEVAFLRYSSHVAQGFTPTLIEVDQLRRCAIMEHVEGFTYPEGLRASQQDIQAIFCFFNKLNSNLELAKEMIQMDAAEGFLSLRQHMGNVFDRLTSMGIEHLPNEYKQQASKILCQLRARAEKAAIRLEEKIDSGIVADSINPDERCISPSDFGFHNAIRTAKGVVFIDFEFAGWDDPAKLCIDLTLQQRNPIRLSPTDVAASLFQGRDAFMSSRINAMTEILILKWFCIVLGIFSQARLDHIISIDCGLSRDLVVSTQLRRYNEYLQYHSIY
jgi:hypothetical protein